MAGTHKNIDHKTVDSFGKEWARFQQSEMADEEHARTFLAYFDIFPWATLPSKAAGFDMGCGSGRWAMMVAPRVSKLTCIDPAIEALDVARRNLADAPGVEFVHGSTDNNGLAPNSQDFGYSLGVLHHIPDTRSALQDCVSLLKPGAPFLLYLYYRFDNRPAWFRYVWGASESVRFVVSKLPDRPKAWATDLLAGVVYWPLARLAWLAERTGFKADQLPLSFYRDKSFYMMRTDSRDRFGTPLEQRFTRNEIADMMQSAGLTDIEFSDREPFWVAVGRKRAAGEEVSA